jgi:ABC-type dipeptide/oligopeptide/nickel transport system permease component
MALNKIEVPTGTQVPRRISAPAAERAFAIAHPKPRSSATPAMKALLPVMPKEGTPIHKKAYKYICPSITLMFISMMIFIYYVRDELEDAK